MDIYELKEMKRWDMGCEEDVILKKYSDGSVALCMSYDSGYGYTGTSDVRVLKSLYEELGKMLYE